MRSPKLPPAAKPPHAGSKALKDVSLKKDADRAPDYPATVFGGFSYGALALEPLGEPRGVDPWAFPVQAKLRIGASDDLLEQEADRVADNVLSHSAAPVPVTVSPLSVAPIQRQSPDKEEGEARGVELISDAATSSPPVAAEPPPDEPPPVQPKRSGDEPPKSSAEFDAGVAGLGSGASLPPATLAFFGNRFGHDFRNVRVHTGSDAAALASSIHASAFTMGRNIVFGHGEYAPGTPGGDRLLAHELTHVLQQRGGDVVQRKPTKPASKPDDAVSFKIQVSAPMPSGEFLILSLKRIFRSKEEEVTAVIAADQIRWVNDTFAAKGVTDEEVKQGHITVHMPESLYQHYLALFRGGQDGSGTGTSGGGGGQNADYNKLPFADQMKVVKEVDDWYGQVSGNKGPIDSTTPDQKKWQKLWKQKADQYATDITIWKTIPEDVRKTIEKVMKPGGKIEITDLRQAIQLAEQIKKLTPEQLEDLKNTGGQAPVNINPQAGSPRGKPGGSPYGVIKFSPKAHLSVDPSPKQIKKYIKGSTVKLRVVFDGPDSECTFVNYFPHRADFDWTIKKDDKVFDSGPIFEGSGSISYDFKIGDPGIYTLSVDVKSGRFEAPTSLHLEETIASAEEKGRASEIFQEKFAGASKPFKLVGSSAAVPSGYVVNPGAQADTLDSAVLTAKTQIAFIEGLYKQSKLTKDEYEQYVKAYEEQLESLQDKQKAHGKKTPYLIKGIFLSRENSIDMPLSMFMFGERVGNQYKITLFDSTLGKVATHTGEGSVPSSGATQADWVKAEGQAFVEMLKHWNKYNDYPDGTLQIGAQLRERMDSQGPENPVTVYQQDTYHPKKTVEKALGYTAMAAGIILLAAAPFTGGTSVPVGIIILQGVAIGASLGALALKLHDRYEQDTLKADRELLMDMIGFVATVLGALGSFTAALKGASTLVKGSYFTTMLGLDVATGILLAASVQDELLQAGGAYKVELARIDMMPIGEPEKEEMRNKAKEAYQTVVARVLASAALNGTFLLVSTASNVKELGAVRQEYITNARVKELLKGASPEDIRAYLDSGVVLSPDERQLLELVSEGAAGPKGGFAPPALKPGEPGRPRLPANDPLVEALPGTLKDKVPIYRDESISGVMVVPIKEGGVVVGVEVRVGKGIKPSNIKEHLPEIQQGLGYTGLFARVKALLEKTNVKAGKTELDEGQIEARTELEKLPRIIEERLAQVQRKEMNPAEAADYILFLKEQMDYYANVLEFGGVPKGYIAAFAPAGATFKIRDYQRLVEQRIAADEPPPGWTGAMEAKFRGWGDPEKGYRWKLEDGKLRYGRMREHDESGAPVKRRTWDPEAVVPGAAKKGAFVDVDENVFKAGTTPGKGEKLAAGDVTFAKTDPALDVQKKVQAAVEGAKGPLDVPMFKSIDEIVQYRQQRTQELAAKKVVQDSLVARRETLEAQEATTKTRADELDKVFQQRQRELTALQSKKPPAEPKEVTTATEAVGTVKRDKATAEKELADTRKSIEEAKSREAALKEEMKPYYAVVVKISEQLAEVAATIHVKTKYPSAELVFGGPGSTTRSGVFDQVWRVPGKGKNGGDLWVVVEAKGGSSDLGTKTVGQQEVQQGTREYFDDTVGGMSAMKSDPAAEKAGRGLESASDDVLYLWVKAPYKIEPGGVVKLGDVKIEQFNIGP